MEIEQLGEYADAWNNHDIDGIMKFMTEDCIFETGGGPDRFGTRYEGAEAVRSRFIEVWTDIPDVRFENSTHFVNGDRGCSEWTFLGTTIDGTKIEIDGCDLFTFVDNKIKLKASYIKQRG